MAAQNSTKQYVALAAPLTVFGIGVANITAAGVHWGRDDEDQREVDEKLARLYPWMFSTQGASLNGPSSPQAAVGVLHPVHDVVVRSRPGARSQAWLDASCTDLHLASHARPHHRVRHDGPRERQSARPRPGVPRRPFPLYGMDGAAAPSLNTRPHGSGGPSCASWASKHWSAACCS